MYALRSEMARDPVRARPAPGMLWAEAKDVREHKGHACGRSNAQLVGAIFHDSGKTYRVEEIVAFKGDGGEHREGLWAFDIDRWVEAPELINERAYKFFDDSVVRQLRGEAAAKAAAKRRREEAAPAAADAAQRADAFMADIGRQFLPPPPPQRHVPPPPPRAMRRALKPMADALVLYFEARITCGTAADVPRDGDVSIERS